VSLTTPFGGHVVAEFLVGAGSRVACVSAISAKRQSLCDVRGIDHKRYLVLTSETVSRPARSSVIVDHPIHTRVNTHCRLDLKALPFIRSIVVPL
jgi:hypothetical protein